ncbi:MAG: 6-bladed beta-propeller [Thiohalospira sp.]
MPDELVKLNVKTAELIEMKDIISNVRCVKLENNNNALFNDCWKIRLHNNYIYIYSLTDFAVYIFSDKGEYVNTLEAGCKGNLTMPTDIMINKKSSELWVINERKTIKRYSPNGKIYLGELELPFQVSAIAYYSNEKFLLYDGNFNKEVEGYITLTGFGQKYQKNVYAKKSSDKNFNSYIPATLFTNTSSNIIYTLLPNNDTIYVSDIKREENFKPLYYLNFGGDFLDESKWPDDGFTDREYAEMMNSGKYIYGINSFYSANNKIFFRTQGRYSKYFMINTKTHQLFNFNNLIDDLSTKTSATSIQGSAGNDIFFIFNSDYLISHYQKRGMKSEYPQIEELLKSLGKDDHKVVFICTVK